MTTAMKRVKVAFYEILGVYKIHYRISILSQQAFYGSLNFSNCSMPRGLHKCN